MLKRDDVIDQLHDLNLPANEYWASARTALVLHGVRYDTESIEIGCTSTLYKELLENNDKANKDEQSLHIEDGQVIVKECDGDEVEYIDDLPVATLNSIKKHKVGSKKAEDIKDIELIDKLTIILDSF